MADAQMTPNDGLDTLTGKIDSLADAVRAGFFQIDQGLTNVETHVAERLTKVETRLTDVETKLAGVTTRLTNVESELAGVKTKLTEVDERLTKVHILAGETDTFAKNSWDALRSLERRMDERFDEARKERKDGFDLTHAAIHSWGKRVAELEAPRRPRRGRH